MLITFKRELLFPANYLEVKDNLDYIMISNENNIMTSYSTDAVSMYGISWESNIEENFEIYIPFEKALEILKDKFEYVDIDTDNFSKETPNGWFPKKSKFFEILNKDLKDNPKVFTNLKTLKIVTKVLRNFKIKEDLGIAISTGIDGNYKINFDINEVNVKIVFTPYILR